MFPSITFSKCWEMYHERIPIMFALFVFFFSPSQSIQRGNRGKRILNGLELRAYDSGYSATQYFVWLSNTHFCGYSDSANNLFQTITFKSWRANRVGYYSGCDVNPQSYMCGGALLTPTIVQTACHCYASVPYEATDHPTEQRYIPDNAFEQSSVAFIGATSTGDMENKKGYISKMFIVHQKCTVGAHQRYITHDYAVVVLKIAVTPDPILYFAPVYTKQVMVDIWYSQISNENVCLFMGYGAYQGLRDLESPSVLRHCWGVIKNYEWCYYSAGGGVPNYTDTNTWYCATSLPEHPGFPYRGDSGTPVTSNNQYIGFVSQGNLDLNVPAFVNDPAHFFLTNKTKVKATVFNLWQNSFQLRPDFEKETEELSKSKPD